MTSEARRCRFAGHPRRRRAGGVADRGVREPHPGHRPRRPLAEARVASAHWFVQTSGRLQSAPVRGVLPAAGVIAASGGNHGAAVAYAAARLGVSAEVMIPSTSPSLKRGDRAIWRAGRRRRRLLRRRPACRRAASATDRLADAAPVRPPATVAGQGTMARELESRSMASTRSSLPAVAAGSRPARRRGSRPGTHRERRAGDIAVPPCRPRGR